MNLSLKLPILVGMIALAAVVGVGLVATNFTAYLGNNPTTCNNCHVMDGAYEGWFHGAHQAWADCTDCHTPHAFIPKYIVKAESGYHHVTAFVFGNIPDAIRAMESSRKVIQANCIRCHKDAVEAIIAGPMAMDFGRYCFDCHRTVAHGERGISLLPYQDKENEK
jgi:cytochrome c nitrite reductase small subunit